MKNIVKFIVGFAALFIVVRLFLSPTGPTAVAPRRPVVIRPPVSQSEQYLTRHKRVVAEAIAAVRSAGSDSHLIAGILDLHYNATQRMIAEVEYGSDLSITEQARLLNTLKMFNLPYEYLRIPIAGSSIAAVAD